MKVGLLVVGAGLVVAGLAAVGLGIPYKEFSVGGTLISPCSSSKKVPDMLSFPPIDASPKAICALYAFILYFNGNPPGFTPSELAGYSANLAVVAMGSAILYAVYRATLRTVLRSLRIQPQRRGRALGVPRTI